MVKAATQSSPRCACLHSCSSPLKLTPNNKPLLLYFSSLPHLHTSSTFLTQTSFVKHTSLANSHSVGLYLRACANCFSSINRMHVDTSHIRQRNDGQKTTRPSLMFYISTKYHQDAGGPPPPITIMKRERFDKHRHVLPDLCIWRGTSTFNVGAQKIITIIARRKTKSFPSPGAVIVPRDI